MGTGRGMVIRGFVVACEWMSVFGKRGKGVVGCMTYIHECILCMCAHIEKCKHAHTHKHHSSPNHITHQPNICMCVCINTAFLTTQIYMHLPP